MTDKDKTPETVSSSAPTGNLPADDNGAGQSAPPAQDPQPSAGWITEGGSPSSLPQTIIAALKG